jgi:hypothetical protein
MLSTSLAYWLLIAYVSEIALTGVITDKQEKSAAETDGTTSGSSDG